MKKSLSKPEHWQDFEALCKKLFGEIWECKNTIRKNGRSGQAQAGVDVYAIPKGEDGYFGIQCKGKDDYTKAKLTENEMLDEIAKAATFEPPLKVFIVATTANKDAAMEAFIRKEDLKSRAAGAFEIQLYAWEDLADLIEENRETFLWYMEGKQFRMKHEFRVLVDGATETTIRPQYYRKITKYITETEDRRWKNTGISKMIEFSVKATAFFPVQERRQYNYAYCPLRFQLCNTGPMVLEDWKFIMTFDPAEVKTIREDYAGEPGGYSVAVIRAVRIADMPLTLDKKRLSAHYQPIENTALIQLDQRVFELWLLPAVHDVKLISAKWELLARDYNASGTFTIHVDPVQERSYAQIVISDGGDETEDETEIIEKITDKEENEETD